MFVIIGSIFCIYLGVATIFPDASFVGSVGNYLGSGNRFLFGYLGFLYPFALAFFLPLVLRVEDFGIRNLEVILSFFLFFIDLLIIQANIFSTLPGYIGFSIVEMLHGFIGSIGVWLFIIMIAVLSLSILIDVNIYEFFGKLFSFKPKTKKQNQDTSFEGISKIQQEKKAEKIQLELEEKKGEMLDFFAQEENVLEREIEIEKIHKNNQKDKMQDIHIAFEIKDDVLKSKNVEVLSEVEENKKLLETLEVGEREKPKDFRLPTLKFLKDPPKSGSKVSESEIDQKISDLLDKLKRFKIDGDVVRTYAGPVVTTFEFRPAPHIKVSKILTLQDDLAMALKAQTIRIQAPVPGKDVVGIEIPNKNIDTIYLKSVLDSDIFKKSSSPLTIALGKDIVGNPFVTDLKKLPHLLIAGTTGSGKSVGINAMLLSLLYRNSPQTLRLLMIDPKMLEFSMYNDIPHLLTPVITQSKEAVSALANMVVEMERRYQIMSKSKTKNIESYNEKASREGLLTIPYIVIIIDELADLMMTSGKDVELYISRLAQMARAAGIHLLVATQRPSVDVVTGLIKANLPSRISFKVGQKIDSKVILDSFGAESLLGRGDMLFTPPSTPGAIRLHAPYASESEIEIVVEYLKTQGEPNYDKSYLKDPNASDNGVDGDFDSGEIDELYEQAKEIVLSEQKTSISYIQRRLQIGYNRAARIIEQLEKMGVLSAPNSKGQREII
ncbi:MAG: cell division protein FtsK [Proteobacteria bacterium]|nr:MAG: cell division protein FtsK [Pseudomonadota bacterium]